MSDKFWPVLLVDGCEVDVVSRPNPGRMEEGPSHFR